MISPSNVCTVRIRYPILWYRCSHCEPWQVIVLLCSGDSDELIASLTVFLTLAMVALGNAQFVNATPHDDVPATLSLSGQFLHGHVISSLFLKQLVIFHDERLGNNGPIGFLHLSFPKARIHATKIIRVTKGPRY